MTIALDGGGTWIRLFCGEGAGVCLVLCGSGWAEGEGLRGQRCRGSTAGGNDGATI